MAAAESKAPMPAAALDRAAPDHATSADTGNVDGALPAGLPDLVLSASARSTRSALPRRLDTGRRAAFALAVQRSVGNAAMATLVRGGRPVAGPSGAVRSPAVQRQPTAPPPPLSSLHGIPHEGRQLTEDWKQMSDLLESMVTERGWEKTESWAYRFINREPLQDALEPDPDLVRRIRERLRTETEQMRRKIADLVRQFETAAVADTKELLDNSERQIKAEAKRYGLKESGWIFKDYSMDESQRGGLQDAARELATKRRACNKALNEFVKAKNEAQRGGQISLFIPELNEPFEAKRRDWVALEDAYHALAADKQRSFPILAAYTTLDDAAAKLSEIASQDKEALAKNLYKAVEDRLANIQTVRDEIGDRFSIWKTPQIMALTKKTMSVVPWQARALDDHARDVRAKEEDNAKIFAAIAIGLGLLAAIPTGGTSVLAGVAAAGAALGAAYSMYNLYEHYKDYTLASAETGTAFDKAQAISQEEPSLLWLASDLLDLGLNLVGAAAAFKALRSAMLAAEASKLQQLPQVIQEAERLGLPAAARSRVVAYVVERTGGSSSVQESLKAILETFGKLQPTRDARLAKAYEHAAQIMVAQGRVGIFTAGAAAGKAEGLTELKRVLAASGVGEPQLTRYAREIASQFASEADMMGAYYSKLDIVIMREGATADILAHELAHRAQSVMGQLDTLGTMRKEYQAFSAQREFLLMLPSADVPADAAWLLRATDEDIKAHVLSSYQGKLLKELRSGATFEPLDEEADSQLIIDMFKIARRRSLM